MVGHGRRNERDGAGELEVAYAVAGQHHLLADPDLADVHLVHLNIGYDVVEGSHRHHFRAGSQVIAQRCSQAGDRAGQRRHDRRLRQVERGLRFAQTRVDHVRIGGDHRAVARAVGGRFGLRGAAGRQIQPHARRPQCVGGIRLILLRLPYVRLLRAAGGVQLPLPLQRGARPLQCDAGGAQLGAPGQQVVQDAHFGRAPASLGLPHRHQQLAVVDQHQLLAGAHRIAHRDRNRRHPAAGIADQSDAAPRPERAAPDHPGLQRGAARRGDRHRDGVRARIAGEQLPQRHAGDGQQQQGNTPESKNVARAPLHRRALMPATPSARRPACRTTSTAGRSLRSWRARAAPAAAAAPRCRR